MRSQLGIRWPRRVLIVASIALALLSLASCGGPSPAPSDSSHERGTYTGTELDGPAPDFQLTNQRGKPIALSDFRGRVVVLAFLDPNCTDVCPLTALHFRQTYEALGSKGNQVVFLAVNVNLTAGSVEDLDRATRKWGLEGMPTWHYLTGSPEELQEVWNAYAVLGGVPKPDKHGEVQHTPGVYVIDQQGRKHRYISTNYEGAPPLTELLVKYTRALLER